MFKTGGDVRRASLWRCSEARAQCGGVALRWRFVYEYDDTVRKALRISNVNDANTFVSYEIIRVRVRKRWP
eukprot:scaffold40354_cov49-Prasinocladus_malaysianus.AAC.1